MNTTANEKPDPMPIGTLGMYFFLASEAMFFIGLLGAFIVLKSAGGQHQLFTQSSQMLSNVMGFFSVVLLLISSSTLRRLPSIAIVAGVLFLIVQGVQWRMLLQHNDGPTQNNYFDFYFLLSSVHALHLVVGVICLLWFLIYPRPISKVLRRAGSITRISGSSEYLRDRLGECKLPDAVQIYWHFVNAVGVITFAALYFV